MKKLLLTLTFALLATQLFAQNDITNTLGTSGSFIVKDASSTFLTLTQSNGNVGIGTATPDNRFEVSGSTFNRITASVTADVQSGFQIIRTAGTNQVNWEMYTPAGSTNLRFAKKLPADGASTDILTFRDNGNVGIGTNLPYSKLEVHDKIIAGTETSTNGTTILEGRYSQSTDDVVNTLGSMHSSGAWLLGYGLRPKEGSYGYISSADNSTWERTGLELSNSFFKLHYASAQSTTVGSDITGLNTRFYVDLANAKVGINTTSPSYNLYVNGTSGGTNAWTNDSDKRLKKDVNLIENGLDKVMKLRPITFYWKQSEFPKRNYDDRNHVGFIAQEVEVVVPQVVSTADDEMKTKSIAYSDLVPVLTKAIQEQQKLIEELRDRISNLENK